MPNNIRIGPVSIYQDIEISLTEHLVPPVVHVKQYDHMARKVRCTLFYNNVEYTIPTDVILVYSGTRPDGRIFQYSTEAVNNDKVALIDNRLVITVTDFMTAVSGRYPVDIMILDNEEDVLGSFSFTIDVQRAAVKNRSILTATFASVAEAIRLGLYEVFITEDGYFGINSDDGLNLGDGSYSDTVDRVREEMLTASINDNGYLEFETDERFGLVFSMDGEGHFIVEYGG